MRSFEMKTIKTVEEAVLQDDTVVSRLYDATHSPPKKHASNIAMRLIYGFPQRVSKGWTVT